MPYYIGLYIIICYYSDSLYVGYCRCRGLIYSYIAYSLLCVTGLVYTYYIYLLDWLIYWLILYYYSQCNVLDNNFFRAMKWVEYTAYSV